MFRAIPTSNKICLDKELKRSWRIHEEKLQRMKGSVGKDKPQQFMFLQQRPKKAAIAEVRNIEIEKENHVLLSKIKTIGQKGCKNSYYKMMESLDQSKKKTLNEPYRKRELVKIVEENQQIMKRIHSKKSMYNTRKWQRQRKKIQKNITLISSFPYKQYPSTQTQVNLWMTSENLSKKKQQNNSLSRSRPKAINLNFSGTKKINDSYFLITSYTKKRYFYIEIENLENPREKYRMQMEEFQVIKLLKTIFYQDIQKLFNCIEIDQPNGCCFLKYEVDDADSRIDQAQKESIEKKNQSRVYPTLKTAKSQNLQK